MLKAGKCQDDHRQATLWPTCTDCNRALKSNVATRCRPCWVRHYRATVCHACNGKKQPSRVLCGSCTADYHGWRRAWLAIAEPKRPPGGEFSNGHLKRLRERAAKKLPLFGGGVRQERTITIRAVVEQMTARWG